MSKIIQLTRGLFTLVDDEDFERLSILKWHALAPGKSRRAWYAVRNLAREGGKRRTWSMQNDIICPLPGYLVDHKDGDGLNNQKSNLRFATTSENCANSKKSTGSSRYRGVALKEGRWRVRICVKYKQVHVGYFKEEFDAATAYNFAAEAAFGEFAAFNTPTGAI